MAAYLYGGHVRAKGCPLIPLLVQVLTGTSVNDSYFYLKLNSPFLCCSFFSQPNCSFSPFFLPRCIASQFSFFCSPPALLSPTLANTSLCNLFAGWLSLWFTVSFLNRIMINGLLGSARTRPTLFTQARSSPCKQTKGTHPLLPLALHACNLLSFSCSALTVRYHSSIAITT